MPRKFRTLATHPHGLGKIPWPPLECEENAYTIWIDEAGCGALAGPMYAAGVVVLPGFDVMGVHDSKLLKPHERSAVYEQLLNCHQLLYHVASVSNQEIQELGKTGAWVKMLQEITDKLISKAQTELIQVVEDGKVLISKTRPTLTQVVVDGNVSVSELSLPCIARPKADSLYVGVAAASILAKEARDRYMIHVSTKYPKFEFLFKKGKGYYSDAHKRLIMEGHYTDIHRQNYNPLKSLLNPTPKLVSKRQKTQQTS